MFWHEEAEDWMKKGRLYGENESREEKVKYKKFSIDGYKLASHIFFFVLFRLSVGVSVCSLCLPDCVLAPSFVRLYSVAISDPCQQSKDEKRGGSSYCPENLV